MAEKPAMEAMNLRRFICAYLAEAQLGWRARGGARRSPSLTRRVSRSSHGAYLADVSRSRVENAPAQEKRADFDTVLRVPRCQAPKPVSAGLAAGGH